jgi:hypothetical protein
MMLLNKSHLDMDVNHINSLIEDNKNFNLFVRIIIHKYKICETFSTIDWNTYENQILLLILSKYFFLL